MPTVSTLNYNPDAPVYAAPETTLPESQVEVDPTKTAMGLTSQYLQQDSPLVGAAQSTATRTANKRGLLNSSIAAGEGTKAAIETVSPLAQKDSELYGNIALNNQVAQLEYQKSVNNAAITGALTAQDYSGKFELQKLSDNAQMQRVEIDNMFKLQLQNDQLDAADRQNVITSVTTMGNETIGSIERILRDTNIDGTKKDPKTGLTAKEAAIQAVMTNYRANVTTAGAIAGLKLTWS